jgi:hypothetical protein
MQQLNGFLPSAGAAYMLTLGTELFPPWLHGEGSQTVTSHQNKAIRQCSHFHISQRIQRLFMFSYIVWLKANENKENASEHY